MSRKSGVDWEPIRAAYVGSKDSLWTVADRFGINRKTVEKHAQRHGWTEARRKMAEAVERAALEQVAKERSGELYEWNKADLTLAKALRTQVVRSIVAAAGSDGTSAPALKPTEIRALVSAAEGVQRLGRLALGATTNNSGISGPDGGPIEGAAAGLGCTPEEYADAMRSVLADFVAPGSLKG